MQQASWTYKTFSVDRCSANFRFCSALEVPGLEYLNLLSVSSSSSSDDVSELFSRLHWQHRFVIEVYGLRPPIVLRFSWNSWMVESSKPQAR